MDVLSYILGMKSGGSGPAPTGTLDITANGTYDVAAYASAAVDVPTGGGNPEAEDNDVIFIDYDGTIRYSYTAADFLKLSAMPENPTHERLAAQGWNWSLEDAQNHVAKYGELVIGQMYTTSDGKTKFTIRIARSGRVGFDYINSGTIAVEWGDGGQNAYTAASGYAYHDYTQTGDYTIALSVSGTMSFDGLETNRGNIWESAFIGPGVSSVGGYLGGSKDFGAVTILPGVSVGKIGLNRCMVGMVFPTGTTAFNMQNCYSMRRVSIPKSVATISANMFSTCPNLERVTLPNGVTSIGSSAFSGCAKLVKMVIPESVTSIEASAFESCAGIGEYHITPTVPPTLGSGVFRRNVDYTIYVPKGTLETYKAASGWSDYADYMQEEA